MMSDDIIRLLTSVTLKVFKNVFILNKSGITLLKGAPRLKPKHIN